METRGPKTPSSPSMFEDEMEISDGSFSVGD